MKWPLVPMLLLAVMVVPGVIIDRIAIVVRNSVIKDSDIRRDIRVTDFLNGQPLSFSLSARKAAAARLINQAIIRREIRLGDYPGATFQEADQQLDRIEKERFKTQSAFEHALKEYGLSNLDLRTEFKWQLTVLRFIDLRFKPAVLVSDQEVNDYYKLHETALRREHPKESPGDLHTDVRDIITGEQVNKLFFDWLDQQRGETDIEFLEGSLR
jgi:parvulin-like peptidyl-prolyl isomerase